MIQDVPKSTVTEQLSTCFPSEDELPPSVLMINTSEWQGQVGMVLTAVLSNNIRQQQSKLYFDVKFGSLDQKIDFSLVPILIWILFFIS